MQPTPDPEKQVIDEPADVLRALPPPPAFNLRVDGLTIAVPPSQGSLPLPFNITLPRWLSKSKGAEGSEPGTIIRDVSLRCDSGEMLAM